MNPLFGDARARTATAAKDGAEGWHDPREDGMLPDAYIAMGLTAENVASMCGISRAEQDEFAVRSQNLAEQAIKNGFYSREITPVELPDGTTVDRDDGPRPGVTLDAVGALKPVFRPDGTVTAGNCCPLNDGAAAVVVMSDRKARELGITPLARIAATGVSALSPEIMGLGPVEATRQAMRRVGMTISDVNLVEINEAFAAQVIPAYRELGIDIDRLNVHGGAIALGHPFGMTGARITATLLNGLVTRDETDRPGNHVRWWRPGHGHDHRAAQLGLAGTHAGNELDQRWRSSSLPAVRGGTSLLRGAAIGDPAGVWCR